MQNRFSRAWLIPVALFALVLLYYVPPIHSRLAWRLDSLKAQIKYMINPPEQAVFKPGEQTQINIAVTRMIQTLQATLTPVADSAALGTSTPQSGPTLQPTIATTPLPATVMLQ